MGSECFSLLSMRPWQTNMYPGNLANGVCVCAASKVASTMTKSQATRQVSARDCKIAPGIYL